MVACFTVMQTSTHNLLLLHGTEAVRIFVYEKCKLFYSMHFFTMHIIMYTWTHTPAHLRTTHTHSTTANVAVKQLCYYIFLYHKKAYCNEVYIYIYTYSCTESYP